MTGSDRMSGTCYGLTLWSLSLEISGHFWNCPRLVNHPDMYSLRNRGWGLHLSLSLLSIWHYLSSLSVACSLFLSLSHAHARTPSNSGPHRMPTSAGQGFSWGQMPASSRGPTHGGFLPPSLPVFPKFLISWRVQFSADDRSVGKQK